MSTITHTLFTGRTAPSFAERLMLQASDRLEALAMARMDRRAAKVNPVTEKARAQADDRRRTAQALGSLGILPR